MKPRITRAPAARLALAALLALLASGCGQSDCEKSTLWLNGASTPCQQCQARQCTMQRAAMTSAQMDCLAEFSCTARCPARSSTTCGCFDQCLTTPACHQAFFDMLSCAAQQCDSECTTGNAAPDAGNATGGTADAAADGARD